MRLSWIFGPLALVLLPFALAGGTIESGIMRLIGSAASEWAAELLVVGALTLDPLLPVPSSLVATLAGARLGFCGGTVAIAAGMSIGVPVGLWAGRTGRIVVPAAFRLPDGAHSWMERHGLTALLLCRPVPVLAEVSLMMAGASGIAASRLVLWLLPAHIGLGALYAAAGMAASSGDAPGLWLMLGSVAIPGAFALLAWGWSRVAPAS